MNLYTYLDKYLNVCLFSIYTLYVHYIPATLWQWEHVDGAVLLQRVTALCSEAWFYQNFNITAHAAVGLVMLTRSHP